MKLKLIREKTKGNNTFGSLYIDGEWFCWTLEDAIREVKVAKETCIPFGVYKVILSMSSRFKKWLPEILNVRDFLGIRIHSGNTNHDTEGCILVGYHREIETISQSIQAKDDLIRKMEGQSDISIEIISI